MLLAALTCNTMAQHICQASPCLRNKAFMYWKHVSFISGFVWVFHWSQKNKLATEEDKFISMEFKSLFSSNCPFEKYYFIFWGWAINIVLSRPETFYAGKFSPAVREHLAMDLHKWACLQAQSLSPQSFLLLLLIISNFQQVFEILPGMV